MSTIEDILAKHFSGETTPEEEAIALDWKKKNPEEYALLSDAWAVEPEVEQLDFDEEVAWSKMEPQFKEDKTTIISLNRFVKFAAAACGLVLIGLGLTWMFGGSGNIELVNETAQANEVKLPDGTVVWMAPQAELSYPKDFTENRTLTFSGEGFFEVARDEMHPFLIKTLSGEIEVLGTAFNVNTANQQTEVSVEHGLVALRNKGKEIKLTVGESAISNATGVSDKTTAHVNYLSWKTGVFTFKDTPLSQVIDDLNGYYNNKIELGDNQLGGITLTASFNQLPLEQVIEIIVITCHIESEEVNGKTILK